MSRECDQFSEALSAYLDREVSGERAQLLLRHLEACEPCQGVLRVYRRVGDLLKQDAERAAQQVDFDLLRRETQARIEDERRGRRLAAIGSFRRRFAWRMAWSLGAAAALLAVVYVGPSLWTASGPQTQTAANGLYQEQLGSAIRNAAGVQHSSRQVFASHQEQLGLYIRDREIRRLSAGAGPSGDPQLQEKIGALIRDYARMRWAMDRQHGEIQEQMGRLIQDHAREGARRL